MMRTVLLKTVLLKTVLVLIAAGVGACTPAPPPYAGPERYTLVADYGNAVQGNRGWRCILRSYDEDEGVREYRVGYLGDPETAMNEDSEDVVIFLSVARSMTDLDDWTSRWTFAVTPGGGLYPFGGFDLDTFGKSNRKTPLQKPESLHKEQVEELKKLARTWIERVIEDPDRDSLTKSFDTAPEGWPHYRSHHRR